MMVKWVMTFLNQNLPLQLVKEEQKVKYLKEKRNFAEAISCQKNKEEAAPSQENVYPEPSSNVDNFAPPNVRKVQPSTPKSHRLVDSSIPTGKLAS